MLCTRCDEEVESPFHAIIRCEVGMACLWLSPWEGCLDSFLGDSLEYLLIDAEHKEIEYLEARDCQS